MSYRLKAAPILDRLRSLVASLDFQAPEVLGNKKHELAVEIDAFAEACGLVKKPTREVPSPMTDHFARAPFDEDLRVGRKMVGYVSKGRAVVELYELPGRRGYVRGHGKTVEDAMGDALNRLFGERPS
jgi:hypothetical protein